MYQTILFDLDGTLTDPGEGITNSVAYALRKFGIEVSDRRELYCFIGPPLTEAFSEYYGFSPEDAKRAVVAYREYFSEHGIFENHVYEGIEALLEKLRAQGMRLVLATSKPEEFANRILVHFGLDVSFDLVVGATMDGRIGKKGDVIREAMRRGNIDPTSAVMIGDRHHDIDGASENGLPSIGVLYGYGSRAELEQAGATQIAESVEHLGRILTKFA